MKTNFLIYMLKKDRFKKLEVYNIYSYTNTRILRDKEVMYIVQFAAHNTYTAQ